MTWFSEKMLISHRCIRGLMSNLINKFWTVSRRGRNKRFPKRQPTTKITNIFWTTRGGVKSKQINNFEMISFMDCPLAEIVVCHNPILFRSPMERLPKLTVHIIVKFIDFNLVENQSSKPWFFINFSYLKYVPWCVQSDTGCNMACFSIMKKQKQINYFFYFTSF